jgi:hypothetical protein
MGGQVVFQRLRQSMSRPTMRIVVARTPGGHTGPVTAQRMSLGRGREQRLHCLPDDIDHFLVERAHDDG